MRKPDLSSATKNQIAQFLLANSSDGVANNGKAKEVAHLFGRSQSTIQRIWAEARRQQSEGIPISLASKKLGAPKKNKAVFDLDKVKNIPIRKRCTIRRLAKELQLSKSTVGRMVKSGKIKAHTNAIKPNLTDKNKLHRLKWSLSQLVVEPQSQKIRFEDMFNVVHIDEKWFYLSRESERYYVLPGEIEPYRSCKSKNFIPKVMFLCVVARPKEDLGFDGKIGIWPFIKMEPAQRSSKNRKKGTMVTKPLDSITKEVTKSFLINQVIPAIKEKWPEQTTKKIFIQQDNAKPHIKNEDPDFRVAATSDGFDIQLICQPPNSPDCNINDLGWFRAIQSLQTDTASYSIEDLVRNVHLSFQNLQAVTLNNVFLSLQLCLTEIMKCKGHNNYKIPHIGKERLIRENILPVALEVDEILVKDCISTLLESEQVGNLPYNLEKLLGDMGF